MKKNPLSKGRAFAIIDDEDFELISRHTWSISTTGYAVKSRKGKSIFMHKLILNAKQVDHINMNKLDNRRANLRETDHKKNAQNTGPRKGKKYKGVRWDRSRNRWAAGIMYDGKFYNLGRFESEEDAARAYDKKAKELFNNPYLNIP